MGHTYFVLVLNYCHQIVEEICAKAADTATADTATADTDGELPNKELTWC